MCVSVLLHISSGSKPFYSVCTFIFSRAAENKQFLRKIGITHILNTAEGHGLGMVNTGKEYYRDTNIKYMGVQLQDQPTTNISAHFAETADFIENGVKSGGNYKLRWGL
jgi:hypothetical protein